MQRCPACDARLKDLSQCSRCGADLSRIMRCERLAEAWLSVSLQALQANRADVAVPAICRSLSFRQMPAAKLLKGFLIQHQYRALYESLGLQSWQDAGDIVDRLRILQGDNETLQRFDELLGYLSAQANNGASPRRLG